MLIGKDPGFVLGFNNKAVLQWGHIIQKQPSLLSAIVLPVSCKVLNATAIIDYTIRSTHAGCSTIYTCSDLFTLTSFALNIDWKDTNVTDGIYWFLLGLIMT